MLTFDRGRASYFFRCSRSSRHILEPPPPPLEPLNRPGVEDAVNPSLEASWRHPWRQDLHTGAVDWPPRSFGGS
ncbi:hypothetical protein [Halorhodospira halochloris]|uniref:hypothetical protein n=1 Tax=Halorhodospira halochloris TaxID=1052 RepID=UPI0013A5A355|nr:hypothetical protein [Halorhodospira halochloris]